MVDPFTPNCISIDAGPDPTNYLPNSRLHWPDHMNHLSVDECISNLKVLLSSKPHPRVAMIVGHGNDGYLVLGAGRGDSGIQVNQEMQTWNFKYNQNIPSGPVYPYYWGPAFEDLWGELDLLVLWGCYVAAGSVGATLLWQAANAIASTVTAYTGEVFGDGSFQGGEWIRTSFGQARHRPVLPLDLKKGEPVKKPLIVVIREVQHSVSLNAVKRGILSLSGYGALVLNSNEAKEVLSLIRFDSPIRGKGGVGTATTGYLVIVVEFEAEEYTLKFEVLGARLVRDPSSPDTYYRLTQDFASLVQLPAGAMKPLHTASVTAFSDSLGNYAAPTFTASGTNIAITHSTVGNAFYQSTMLLEGSSQAYAFATDGSHQIQAGVAYTVRIIGSVSGSDAFGHASSITSTITYPVSG